MAPFLPLLKAGEILQVGKGATDSVDTYRSVGLPVHVPGCVTLDE